jgi:hypothetical protein
VDGVFQQGQVDVVVGGPPGEHAPARVQLTNKAMPDAALLLLNEPPTPRSAQYRHHKRAKPAVRPTAHGPAAPAVPQSCQIGSADCASSTEAPSYLDLKVAAELSVVRSRLVAAVSGMCLDVHSLRVSLRCQARQMYAEHAREGPAGSRSSDSCLALQAFNQVYVKGMLHALRGPALRLDMALATRQLAVTVLGCTGGVGHRWGLKWDAQLRRLVHTEQCGPFFDGPDGPDKVQRLLHDYGPLWQVSTGMLSTTHNECLAD